MMRLREIRLKRGKTQFEVGKAINLPASRISDIECGKRTLKFAEAIEAAKFLNVSLDELAGLEGLEGEY